MPFGFNLDRSKADIEELISSAVNAVSETLTGLINGKADSSHTHAAADITDGTLPVGRGGTGQTSLQALRSAAGLGNTTGALPVANGGTGATAAAAARTNLGATAKRNLTANYAGSASGNPDFLLKTFTGTFNIAGTSFPQTHDVSVSVSGYTAIAVAGLSSASPALPTTSVGAVVKDSSTATIRLEHSSAGSGQFSYTMQILYVRTAMINQ